MSSWESCWQNAALEDATPTNAKSLPTIQNVPFTLRKGEEFKKYYEPKMFSFGPFHHGKFSFGENLKLKIAIHFVRQNNIAEAELGNDIMKNLSNLKDRYDQQTMPESVKDDEDLARVFLVDGCAVLHFIYCVVQNKLDVLHIKKDQVAFAQHDLFLLENQLPYSLLQLLIDKIEEKQKYQEAIAEFVKMNMMVKGREKAATSSHGGQSAVTLQVEDYPSHLLDLLHKKLLANMKDKDTSHGGNKLVGYVQKIMEFCVRKGEEKGGGQTGHFPGWTSYRSVNELKASGIWLRPSEGISLRDIMFQGYFGVGILKLPRLVVDDSTAPKLFNLIAYEMCPDFINDFVVISYVCFLDSIIDEPGDVKELRKANILLNALGSDQEVADLFNEISRDLAGNPDIYNDVTRGIEQHYNSKVTTLTAQYLHEHFDSPWTILGSLGVFFGLGVTCLQTYYTIYPVH